MKESKTKQEVQANDKVEAKQKTKTDLIAETINEEEIKKIKLDFKPVKVELEYFNSLEAPKQFDYIKNILINIYNDVFNVDRKTVLKCVSLTCDPDNSSIHLPYGVNVEKDKKYLIFKPANKKKNILQLIVLVNALIFLTLSATYSAISLLSVINLNKDLDKDGIADINIDMNNDKKAEINVDTDSDDIPNLNIDYKGNRESLFNVDSDFNKSADLNLITYLREGEKCEINMKNCDINGDGWPDMNIDIDGNGTIDLDIDTDQDGVVDLNLDTDGDKVCDINCDTDGDMKCDEYCIVEIREILVRSPQSGTSSQSGNDELSASTAELLIRFTDTTAIDVDNLFPTDQGEGFNTTVPDKEFSVENASNVVLHYNVGWIVDTNTFLPISGNFQYRVLSGNNVVLNYTVYPHTDTLFLTDVAILPGAIHYYTVQSRLYGIEAPQDYDQGKTFSGHLEVTPAD